MFIQRPAENEVGKMETQELELVDLARQGDELAFGQLFEIHQSGAYNFACSILKNPEDAKDVTQEAFIKTFSGLSKLKDANRFSSYLYTTVRNLAFDELKRKSRFTSPELLESEEESYIFADPQRALLLSEQQAHVRTVVNNLPDDYRALLYLRELEDMSYDDISQVMGMPKNSVGVLLLRARLKFRQEFRMAHIDIDSVEKDCRDMLPLLSAYVDGELPDDKREMVEAHLEACPVCRMSVEEMTEASKSYRALIPLVPPSGIRENVLAKVGDFLKPRRIIPIKVLAISLTLFLAGGSAAGFAVFAYASTGGSDSVLKAGALRQIPHSILSIPSTSKVNATESDAPRTVIETTADNGLERGEEETPAQTPATPAACRICGGTGLVDCACANGRVLCANCGGDGWITYDPIEGIYTDCKFCVGGWATCTACGGRGKLDCPACGP